MKKKQVAVIGLGRLGDSVATTLFDLGHDVLALDIDEDAVQNIASRVTHAVQADATNERTLRELGIGNFDIVIVTTPAVENSLLATILLKKLGVSYIIARADSELHGSILEKIGADKVIYPEREMGTMIAHVLNIAADAIDFIPVAPGYGVVKMTAPPYFVGESFSALGFGPKGEWGVAVLLLERGKEVIIAPPDSEVVKVEDVLIVAGSDEKLEALLTQAQKARTKQ
ncbi:MAG: TrkA family potassium uptake protein [Chloroflexota bacterium]